MRRCTSIHRLIHYVFSQSSFNQPSSILRQSLQNIRRPTLPTTIPRNPLTAVTVQPPTFELRRSRKDTDRPYSFKCCFVKCENNDKSHGISFTKIPKKPETKADMNIPRNVRTFNKKLVHHNLLMSRCGLKDKIWKQSMRYCSEHATENVRLKKKIDVCGLCEEIEYEFANVPTGAGIQTQPKTLNVRERRAVRDWKEKEDEMLENHGNNAL